MRTKLIVLGVLVALSSLPAMAAAQCGKGEYADPCLAEYNARYCADDCYRDDESHPLRIMAYAVNPIGVALEWAIYRPIHWAVSRPSTAPIFGHTCEYDY